MAEFLKKKEFFLSEFFFFKMLKKEPGILVYSGLRTTRPDTTKANLLMHFCMAFDGVNSGVE